MFQFLYERNEGANFWTPVVMISIGVAVFAIEVFGGLRAAYGRYNKSNIGLSAPIAWFLQESPAFFIPLYFFFMNETKKEINANSILLLFFLIHYFNRYFKKIIYLNFIIFLFFSIKFKNIRLYKSNKK